MNLPVRLLFITGLTALCLTGFKPKPAAEKAPDAPRQMLYYFYTYPYDFYSDRKTLAQEEYELWALYGFNVDTSPSGGTLLVKGYFNDAYPHNQLPMVLLYGHFPFMVK